MSKKTDCSKNCKLSDDAWDGIAAVCIIAIIVTGVSIWLSQY